MNVAPNTGGDPVRPPSTHPAIELPLIAHGPVPDVLSAGDVPAVAEPPEVPRATIRLEKKHPLAIRWMHWINFPVLFTMIWSGLLIYWGDSDNAYQHPHRVYRIGVGSWTLFRFFPEWVYR